MKKLCVVLALVALLAGFCACEKEEWGVYNPKLKINMIYSEEDGHYLQEQWTWDGDLLTKTFLKVFYIDFHIVIIYLFIKI